MEKNQRHTTNVNDLGNIDMSANAKNQEAIGKGLETKATHTLRAISQLKRTTMDSNVIAKKRTD